MIFYRLKQFKYLLLLILLVVNANCFSDADHNKTDLSVDTHIDNDSPYISADAIVNATLGKNIALTCTVHNLKNYKIAWYHDGILLTLDTIRIYDDERYTIENPKSNEWKLVINSIDLNDEGLYSCRLSNGLKKIIHLKVGVPPKFTSNDSSHQIFLNANEFENLTLSCEAYGNPMPTIYWYRKNKFVSTGVNLHIQNITRHNHFEYECVSRNNVPPDASRHFKININFEPTVSLMYHLQTYLNYQSMGAESVIKTNELTNEHNGNHHRNSHNRHVNEDIENIVMNDNQNSIKNLEFVCEIHGNPIYSISWFKDSLKLREMTSFINVNYINVYDRKKPKMISIITNQIKTYKYLSRLQIKNVDEKDNGIYMCIVHGIHGNVSKAVHVIDIKPTPENVIDIETKTQNILVKNSNKKVKHKTTTPITTTKSSENKNRHELTNNIIELNIDDAQTVTSTSTESKRVNYLIDNNNYQHANSIENNNPYMSNRGPRSNSTYKNDYNKNYYLSDMENKTSHTHCTCNFYYFLLLVLSMSCYFFSI